MKTKNLLLSIFYFIFTLVGMGLALLLLFEHLDPNFNSSFMQNVCSAGHNGGCQVAKQSNFSTLFGYPVALWGFMFYTFVAMVSALYFKTKSRFHLLVLFIFTSLALVADLGFFLYSIIELNTVCFMCMLTWITTLILETLIVIQIVGEHKKEKLCIITEFKNCQKAKAPMKLVNTIVVILLFFVVGFSYEYGNTITINKNTDIRRIEQDGLKRIFEKYDLLPVETIDVAGSPAKGAEKPFVTIVEFSDFLCPFCSLMTENIKKLMEAKFMDRYPNKEIIKVIFKNYPLDKNCNTGMKRQMHEGACLLSYAGYCAQQQNKFWDMHDLAFSKQDQYYADRRKNRRNYFVNKNEIMNLAKTIDLDMTKFSSCMISEQTKQAIQKDLAEGTRLKIGGTPSLFVNGKKVNLLNSSASLNFYIEKIIAHEIRKKQNKRKIKH